MPYRHFLFVVGALTRCHAVSLGADHVHNRKEVRFFSVPYNRWLATGAPCGRLHGHNYEVEVILQLAKLDTTGFVRDYRELSALKDFLDATMDHNHLNDVLGHDQTTAEIISQWIYEWCVRRWPEVIAVRVYETPRTWAEYRP